MQTSFLQYVTLDFTEFNTESCCDTVNIYDGDSTKARLIAKLSGSYVTPPTGLNTTQRYMFIRFTTDDTITARGFAANYQTTSIGLIDLFMHVFTYLARLFTLSRIINMCN